jgi:hypothetical protein
LLKGTGQNTSIMDDDKFLVIIVVAYIAAVHQLLTSYSLLFDDVPTVREKRLERKCKREATHTNAMSL